MARAISLLITVKTLRENIAELNSLIIQYRYEEALDKFYDEAIVTHENERQPIVGLIAYKEMARKVFLDNVSNYSAAMTNQIISGDIVVSEWHYKFDHKLWGKWDKIQVSVQRWKKGRIVHERHHYE